MTFRRLAKPASALVLAAAAASTTLACGDLGGPQGGANANDQSNGGTEGALLLRGAMTVSPYGDYALMQRNDISVLVDLRAKTAKSLSEQVDRFVYSKDGREAFALLKDRSIAAIDLATAKPRWTLKPAYKSGSGALLANLSEDGKSLLLGDTDRVLVIDTVRGDVKDAISLQEQPTFIAVVPGTNRMLVAGTTKWVKNAPQTGIYEIDLATLNVRSTIAANCHSTIQVLPDASRAFMSPTFCEEGKETKPKDQWTNPDPVSVIDLRAEGPVFLKNLPGFGPVAMDKTGTRLVAYLDMQRIDEAMFEDKVQIPSRTGDQFHLMVIEPKSLAFTLSPIGAALPRFAMTPDGAGVLVDATVTVARGEVDFKLKLTPGGVSATVSVFGESGGAPVGYFDLSSRKYSAFVGAAASLDRFVQLRDASAVYTLKSTADGLGGDLFRLDPGAKSAANLNKNLRDIGLLADGKTLLLRIRKPAAYTYNASARSIRYYRQESYCLSLDGVSCSSSIEWRDAKEFAEYTGCASEAAAAAGECRCKETHDCY